MNIIQFHTFISLCSILIILIFSHHLCLDLPSDRFPCQNWICSPHPPFTCYMFRLTKITCAFLLFRFCQRIQIRPSLKKNVKAFMASCFNPAHLSGGPPLVDCPRLLIQHIGSWSAYLEAVHSTRDLRMRHTLITRHAGALFLHKISRHSAPAPYFSLLLVCTRRPETQRFLANHVR
jgi:hypothetical protein